MFSKYLLKTSMFLLISIMFLSACNASSRGSELKFSFNTGTPSNSSDTKSLYFNNDKDKIKLNAELKVDSGDVNVQVINTANQEVVWDESYKEDSSFIIELLNVKANSEYLLKVESTQSKQVELIITSDDKLTKDKEKPERYKIE